MSDASQRNPREYVSLDNILNKEKQPELSQIDPDFYEKAARLVLDLDDEKNRTEPDSTKYVFVAQHLETTKAIVRDIIQLRMRKMIKYASSLSAKIEKSQEPLPLTREEREFYDALVELMTAFRNNRFDQVFGKRVKKEKEKEPEPEKQENTQNLRDYTMLRMLTDVPTFVGMDNHSYTLAKEDVATVPGVNAKALVAKKAAVQIVTK